jgi:hypothetical protein
VPKHSTIRQRCNWPVKLCVLLWYTSRPAAAYPVRNTSPMALVQRLLCLLSLLRRNGCSNHCHAYFAFNHVLVAGDKFKNIIVNVQLVPDEVMKAHSGGWGVQVQLHSYLTSAMNVGGWLTLHPSRFTSGGGGDPRYPLNTKQGGPQSWLGWFS